MSLERLIKECKGFDWDAGNREKNDIKHKVSQQECESVFFEDPIIVSDEAHSIKELRLVAFGKTIKGRLLSVFFTVRGKKIRIISARDQSKKEKVSYLKTKNEQNN